MVRRSTLPLLLLVAATFAAAPAAGQVNDYADIFSPSAEQKAMQSISDMKSKFKRTLLIETYAKAPAGREAELQQKGRERFVADLAAERGRGVDGIVFVIVMDLGRFEIAIGNATKAAGLFTDRDRDDMRAGVTEALKAKQYDEVLSRTATFVHDRMAANQSQKANTGGTPPPPAAGNKSQNQPSGGNAPRQPASPSCGAGGFSLSSLVCVGLALAIGFVIIRGVMRARSQRAGYGQPPYGPGGAGPGGYGPQGGYGQGGYGQGRGGGFGQGIMGGLLGGMAGGWLGNKVFGQSQPPADSQGGAGGVAPSDPGTPHDTSFDSGGGDFGGGGGDFGGGGGDSGGGGDF